MWLVIPLVECGGESSDLVSDLVSGSGFLSFLVLSSCRLVVSVGVTVLHSPSRCWFLMACSFRPVSGFPEELSEKLSVLCGLLCCGFSAAGACGAERRRTCQTRLFFLCDGTCWDQLVSGLDLGLVRDRFRLKAVLACFFLLHCRFDSVVASLVVLLSK